MGVYRLSSECENDLSLIYEFGIENFGILQAQKYLLGMHELFQTLSDSPNIGRNASEFSPLLRRFNYKSHMVFYSFTGSGIFIVRVLHHSLDYDRHF